MRSSHLRKSLAASAILATSVASAVGLVQSANATTPGAANSPLSITDGTPKVVLNGQVQTYTGNISEGAWSPDGSLIAFVQADGAVVTERVGGAQPQVVAPAKAGVTRSHPTWVDNGTGIVFSETSGGVSKLSSVPAYTAPGGTVQQSDPLSFLAGHPFTEGKETLPESDGKSLAFVHHDDASGHDQIWVQDDFGRGSAGPYLAADDATSPTLSPDGKTLAFVRKDSSGDRQLWTVPLTFNAPSHPLGTATQLTHDAHDHTSPAWSPDGSRIAYENGPGNGAAATDVQSVAKDGSGQRQEWNKPGTPSYQTQVKDSMTRLAGADRIGTANAASQAQWKAGSAGAVVLTRSDQFADALGGSTLAVADEGPLLLTPTDHLDAGVKAEIARVLGAPKDQTVYVLGGEQALSPAVFNAVKAMGYKVQRVAGADRYETSIAIANEVTHSSGGSWNQPDRVLVATGNKAPDALSAGAAAESGGASGPPMGVVVLTNEKTMPASTAAYLAQVKAHDAAQSATPVYGVGGQADTALTSIGYKHTPLVGADRFQTSYLVAKTFFSGWNYGSTPPRTLGFATGLDWPDALAGGAFMGHAGGPLLLVDAGGEPAKDAEYWMIDWASSISSAYIFGGDKAVPPIATYGLPGLYAGPGGHTETTNPKA